jgi:riboflavin synthase
VFTGLIADLGSVVGLERDADGAQLRVASSVTAALATGDSVAVNGICLTATALGDGEFRAQAMAETLGRSTLGTLAAGDLVNLELPLRAGDRLGGHIVQGHVDGTGRVSEVHDEGFSRVLRIDLDAVLLRYLVVKGSVAVEGVSLTVSDLGPHSFSVSLIPETLQRTTLGSLGPGDVVNIEVDVLAKHIERLLEGRLEPSGGPLQPSGGPLQPSGGSAA